MKKKLSLQSVVACLICLFLFSCSGDREEKRQILAKINNYEMTLEEFEKQLKEELEMEPDFKLTKEAKKDFLEQLIQKEILIQEAKERNLDRKEKFIRTIEKYWESTLIRDLMETKGQEIKKRCYISQEEIEKRYDQLKQADDQTPPLDKIQEKISEELKNEKKRTKLKDWIDELRKESKVEIDEKLLFQK